MKKSIGEQIRDATIEAKRIAKEMERIWNNYYDIKFGKDTIASVYLPCDSCDDKEE